MHRVLILFAAYICVMGGIQDVYEQCKLVIENRPDANENCCNDFISKMAKERLKDLTDKSVDCMEIPISATDCEQEMCLARKFGVIMESGRIDKYLMERIIVELNLFEEGNVILDVLKDNCIYTSDHDAYGIEGACEIKKLLNCIHTQMLFQCKHWKTSEYCIEFHKVTDECAGLL